MLSFFFINVAKVYKKGEKKQMVKKIIQTTLLILIMAFSTIAVLSTTIEPAQGAPSARQPTAGPLPSGAAVNATLKTSAHLSFRPTTIGLNQIFLINMWVSPGLHVERFLPDFTLTITKPDGTKDVIKMDSFKADGTAWLEYVADQAGEWKLKFDFLGCYFPEGVYWDGVVYDSVADLGTVDTQGQMFRGPTYIEAAYYQPSSSPEMTLTVNQDYAVYSWPDIPMPTDYWTRPLLANENRNWWPMAGNYPGTGYFNSDLELWDELYPGTNPSEGPRYFFHPWVQAPNSAHIVWKRQTDIAGFTGPDLTYHSTGSVTQPTVVFAGRAYATETVTINDVPTNCATCYDIRTGEYYYKIPTAAPYNGTTPQYISYNVLAPNWISRTSPVGGTAGTAPGEQKIEDPDLIALSGGYLIKINPWTGATTRYSIAPLTGSGGTYYKNGFVYGIQNLGASAANATGGQYRFINWTVIGNSNNFTTRIISNTSYALSSFPALIDWNVGLGATVSTLERSGTWIGTTVRGFNMITGQSIWNVTLPESCYSSSTAVADHGKVGFVTQQGYSMALDLSTGAVAWRGEMTSYPWDSSGFGAYSVSSAYGMMIRYAYSGVYAIDWDTGKTVWKFESPAQSPYEAPYTGDDGDTVFSFNGRGVIADGKLYTYNAEHSATYPLTRGWSLYCINITTGELIWDMLHPMSPGAIADGYMTAGDTYMGYMYVFGKGKSTTTVTAPDVVISKGDGVVIKGTVLDMSPAQPGTPCISKESMSLQMEYLHLQRPIGGLWNNETITGVPVTVSAIDPNGNPVIIGTVTTNGYYGTFAIEFTPELEGTYEIMASFAGDDSYGSSGAGTAIVVGAPAATIAPTVTPTQSVTEQYFVPSVIGIVVAIVIVGLLLAFLLLKKRP